MSVSEIFERDGRARRVPRPRFDLIGSKLRRPPLRPGIVDRPELLRRMAEGDDRQVVSMMAPPGYGKSTLLSQWANRGGPPFAWVTVEEADNDPKVLLAYIAAALDEIEPIDGRVFDALASSASSVPGSVVPRLGSAFASMSTPLVLVLDDVHVLHNRECRSALSVLADHVPAGSRLVLAGRADPPLRIAQLRAEGRILEVGPDDLSLTGAEASSLLQHAGVALGEEKAAELHRRTEGWPARPVPGRAGHKAGGERGETALAFTGDDLFMGDYLRSRAAGPAPRGGADVPDPQLGHRPHVRPAVRRDARAARFGRDAGRAGPLEPAAGAAGRAGTVDRYHHLFRDLLLAELHRLEPGLIPVLRQRAARWHEANGQPGEALAYWMQAGEVESVARLVAVLSFPAYQRGRTETVERWFSWLGGSRGPWKDYPAVAVLAGLVFALAGNGGGRAVGAGGRAGEPRWRRAARPELLPRAMAGVAPGAAVPLRRSPDAGPTRNWPRRRWTPGASGRRRRPCTWGWRA